MARFYTEREDGRPTPTVDVIDLRHWAGLQTLIQARVVASTELVEFWMSRAVGGAPHMAEPAALLGDHRAPLVGSGC